MFDVANHSPVLDDVAPQPHPVLVGTAERCKVFLSFFIFSSSPLRSAISTATPFEVGKEDRRIVCGFDSAHVRCEDRNTFAKVGEFVPWRRANLTRVVIT